MSHSQLFCKYVMSFKKGMKDQSSSILSFSLERNTPLYFLFPHPSWPSKCTFTYTLLNYLEVSTWMLWESIKNAVTRVYFSRDYIFCRGDRYVLAYICAKNLNLIIWHLLHMCYPNKNRFILIFSLLTYCANLCLQFANLCLQFRVIIFRQIFDSALPWAVCCAGVLFI